jgi:3-phenylpropionate/trans-cinnamate dioxygenase ferredoxin reductase component
MSEQKYGYVIVGAGLAGASAIEGIRERDAESSILMIGNEEHPPYHRPPLSKKLWFGQKKVEDIFVQAEDFFLFNNVDLLLGDSVTRIDPARKTVVDDDDNEYGYNKLLLATGGTPRTLDIPGGDMEGIFYYRRLDDYLELRSQASEGKTAVVIGGGYIGSEMAAALTVNKVDVTMVFPEPYLVQRIFPEALGRAIQEDYVRRGVRVIAGDLPRSLERRNGRYITHTANGQKLESDIVLAGVGIRPNTELAQMAGLSVENGISVNEYLQTSNPDVYAVGDNAYFPYQALQQRTRIEHWDNALNQGKAAGLNMAGEGEQFTYMPYFFSDLFDFGYEAVGDVDSSLETFTDWQMENETGVIYYLKEGRVRGAMMCNVWDKVDAAREIIRKAAPVTREDLLGAIK